LPYTTRNDCDDDRPRHEERRQTFITVYRLPREHDIHTGWSIRHWKTLRYKCFWKYFSSHSSVLSFYFFGRKHTFYIFESRIYFSIIFQCIIIEFMMFMNYKHLKFRRVEYSWTNILWDNSFPLHSTSLIWTQLLINYLS